MAEDNFQLNNHQVFPNNTIPSVETIREHREEIDNRYFDKVINYCMRNDISPKEYFEKELDKPKTPSPEKFSYHSMEMKAWEVERGTYQEPTYQPEYYVYTGPTLGDKIGDWLYERSLDSQGLSEQEKETLRAKHDAEKNMAKEQKDRLREKEYLNSLKQQGDPALQKNKLAGKNIFTTSNA